MPSKIQADSWLTARLLHQIQLLSCDLCDFTIWESPDHCAPFWRLYWHNRSGAEITVGGAVIPISPGKIFLIPPNTHFSSRLRRPVRQLFLHFLVEPHYRGAPDTIHVLKCESRTSTALGRLSRDLAHDSSRIDLSFQAHALVSEMLARLPESGWTARYEDVRITQAVASIEKAYPARLPNARLAKAAGMAPSAFIRLFRACTGHTPLDHLINLRLAEACTMLHQDEASLDEIAQRTGFGDRHYFTRVFSKRQNCPPARYRKLVNVSGRLRPKA